MRLQGFLLSGAFLLAACSSSGDSDADKESRRLWGRDRLADETAQKAKEVLDPYFLDTNDTLRQRVLSMDFEEVVARMGFVEYRGVAKFDLNAGGKTLSITEDTTIQHGLHGSFRVLQLDENGETTRETIYNNGVFYVRNGGGQMRVQGIIKDQHLVVRDEAWQPLRVYTSYYGPRLGLQKIGSGNVEGRAAARYKWVLVEGPELVSVKGIEGQKKPVSITGELFVDEQTGVPIKTVLRGVLEIPGVKVGEPGRLTLSLESTLKTAEGVEIKPKSYIPTIVRHKTDLAPLAFLDGGTHTSTIIGGKKIPTRPPEAIERGEAPNPKTPDTATTTKTTTPPPEKTTKKKKKKRT